MLIYNKRAGAWLADGGGDLTFRRWEADRFAQGKAAAIVRKTNKNSPGLLELHNAGLHYRDAARRVDILWGGVSDNSWQCLGCGRVYSEYGAEEMARRCHCSEFTCERCGKLSKRIPGWTLCEGCRRLSLSEKDAARMAAAELVAESALVNCMVTNGLGDFWRSTTEYLEDCATDDSEPWEFLYVAEFEPVCLYARDILENAAQEHSEDTDDQVAEVAAGLIDAVEEFNKLCIEKNVGSYGQVSRKVRVPVEDCHGN